MQLAALLAPPPFKYQHPEPKTPPLERLGQLMGMRRSEQLLGDVLGVVGVGILGHFSTIGGAQ